MLRLVTPILFLEYFWNYHKNYATSNYPPWLIRFDPFGRRTKTSSYHPFVSNCCCGTLDWKVIERWCSSYGSCANRNWITNQFSPSLNRSGSLFFLWNTVLFERHFCCVKQIPRTEFTRYYDYKSLRFLHHLKSQSTKANKIEYIPTAIHALFSALKKKKKHVKWIKIPKAYHLKNGNKRKASKFKSRTKII